MKSVKKVKQSWSVKQVKQSWSKESGEPTRLLWSRSLNTYAVPRRCSHEDGLTNLVSRIWSPQKKFLFFGVIIYPLKFLPSVSHRAYQTEHTAASSTTKLNIHQQHPDHHHISYLSSHKYVLSTWASTSLNIPCPYVCPLQPTLKDQC